MIQIRETVQAYCRENRISVSLSFEMPEGYDHAHGTYDMLQNTLFLNTGILQESMDVQAMYYLIHELRHAVQYQHPERFDAEIRKSLPYVILYNGTCFRLYEGKWHECRLEGEETYFTKAYLNLPYEKDANIHAYKMTKEKSGGSDELEKLAALWIPESGFDEEEYRKLFSRIDQQLHLPSVGAQDLFSSMTGTEPHLQEETDRHDQTCDTGSEISPFIHGSI